jgi:Domain of unknown function (DUF4476)
MKQLTLLYLVIFSINPFVSLAQLNHFVYLQTENRQPFYVKMGKEIFNSTVSGYLIIPKLQDSTYNFSIGFLNADNKEHSFSCTINKKDVGYTVKNFSDKGLGLFNLQTLQVTMSAASQPDIAQTNKTDAFSNLLSTVVNDPAIKQENPVQAGAKPESIDSSVLGESKKAEPVSLIASTDIKKDTFKVIDNVVSEAPYILSTIKKQQASQNPYGMNITYEVNFDNIKDTVTLLIPSEKSDRINSGSNELNVVDTSLKKESHLQKNGEENLLQKSLSDTVQTAIQKSSYKVTSDTALYRQAADKKFLDIDLDKNKNRIDSAPIIKPVEALSPSGLIINSDCKSSASADDFLKLRKKMAAAKSEEEMISGAKKMFKSKCFTTDQIKNLGVLFLKDADRYNFFDVSYPFVSDTNNFNQLEDQLTEKYYKSRFNAMIRH